MHTAALSGSIESVAPIDDDDTVAVRRPAGLAWNQLPRIAQAYVLVVAVAGGYALAQAFPRTFPEPFLFLALLIAAPHVDLEGHPSAAAHQRFHAVRVVRGRPDGAAAARPE